jgi:RP/EB family microtubule-associated protein
MKTEVMQSKLTIEGLEKERDFYFGKLRDIEVLAQEVETEANGNEILQKILNVLYATEASLNLFRFHYHSPVSATAKQI